MTSVVRRSLITAPCEKPHVVMLGLKVRLGGWGWGKTHEDMATPYSCPGSTGGRGKISRVYIMSKVTLKFASPKVTFNGWWQCTTRMAVTINPCPSSLLETQMYKPCGEPP